MLNFLVSEISHKKDRLMYLRNYLIYINIIYSLNYIHSLLEEFLKESGDFIDDYKERLTQSVGSRRWNILTKRLFKKMFRIDSIINKGFKMDFIEASNLAKQGKKVRRKSWIEGGDNSWQGSKRETSRDMWWNEKYQCLLAGAPDKHVDESTYLDTDGWIYICRGTDMEAKDWELAK